MNTRVTRASLVALCFCVLVGGAAWPAPHEGRSAGIDAGAVRPVAAEPQADTKNTKPDKQLARVLAPGRQAPQAQAGQDGVSSMLQRLEQAVRAGDVAAYRRLLAPVPGDAAKFAQSVIRIGTTRVALRERGRVPLGTGGDSLRLAVDVFCEFGRRAQLSTWIVDTVRRAPQAGSPAADEWEMRAPQLASPITALYSLALGGRQFAAKDLVIAAEGLELRLPDGIVFAAETEEGPTALVLVGRGHMVFKPAPQVEREQMKIFSGSDGIDTAFTSAYVRLSPYALAAHVAQGTMKERTPDERAARLADETFRADNGKSYGVNLGDLATGQWSLTPGTDDFVAEVHTPRYNILTYTRSSRGGEDISLFDRATRRYISVYTSRDKLAQRGRFYDDDDGQDYDVIHYDIDASFDPLRQSLASVARVTVQIRVQSITMLTLKLAESLSVDSVVSREFGRLFAMRVVNQNSFIVGLPKTVSKGDVLAFTISYHGRIAPQTVDREALTLDAPQEVVRNEEDVVALEPSYLYSNRNYWYPQSETGTYATATLRVKVPGGYSCVASGDPEVPPAKQPARPPLAATQFVFRAVQPVRYLSVLITRLQSTGTRRVDGGIEDGSELEALQQSGAFYRTIDLNSFATPMMRGRAGALSERAADVLHFYSSLIGDCPYPTMALAVVERELPGGHSPGYLAVLSEPVLSTPYEWRNDPTNFPQFPEFFLAHEIAHQWWGQAVGWKNYHEQWLSEGLSQYFAALYAEKLRGKETFGAMIRRMQEWAVRKSGEGPVYLGYRIGHVKREPQLFRAIIYNKSATVLHMLRRLIGDDAFLRGLRRFYQEWRFRRAGTDDLRRAFEAESGRSLGRFFDRWIFDSRVPVLQFSWRTERNPASGEDEAVLRFMQMGDVFDVPVTVTLNYAGAPPVDVVVAVTEQVTEMRVPIRGKLRGVEANRDRAAIVRIEK